VITLRSKVSRLLSELAESWIKMLKADSINSTKSSDNAVEIRCNNDHTLLFKASGIDKGQIETVCRKCKQKRLIKFPVVKKAS
jgi:hypothetical protein